MVKFLLIVRTETAIIIQTKIFVVLYFILLAMRAEISEALYKLFIVLSFQDIALFSVWGFLMA